MDDYKLLTNTLQRQLHGWTNTRSHFIDQTSSGEVMSLSGKSYNRFQIMSAWVSTGGELHYLTSEKNLALG